MAGMDLTMPHVLLVKKKKTFPDFLSKKWLKFDRNGREGYGKTLCEMLIEKSRRSFNSVGVKGEQTPTLKFSIMKKSCCLFSSKPVHVSCFNVEKIKGHKSCCFLVRFVLS